MSKEMNIDLRDHRAAVAAAASADARSMTAYSAYAYVLDRILSLLQERYGQTFELYVSDDGREDYWELLEQDVQSGEHGVQFVARIFDYIESRAFGLKEEEGESAAGMGVAFYYAGNEVWLAEEIPAVCCRINPEDIGG